MRKPKNILYPLLEECALKSTDEFWKNLYEELSVGKCTKGVYIQNNIVSTYNKKTGFCYSIVNKTSDEIMRELHILIMKHTNLCSKKDLDKKNKILSVIKNELQYEKWSNIKRK